MIGRAGTALVAAVALAASLPSLRNGFVYDDVPAVRDDPRLRSLDLVRLTTMPYWRPQEMRDLLYRPATTVSFALDWAAGKGSALPFHLTNVVLHVLATLLVLSLAARVLGRGPGAIVAGLWFAVHPAHVEVFAGVVGRSELLAAACFLGAVLAYVAEADAAALRPAGARRAALAAIALACSAVAFGSKEHAFTLPAALVLADAWHARRMGRSVSAALVRHGLLLTAVIALAALALAARAAALGTALGGGRVGAGLEGLNAAGRALVMLPAFLVWARLLAWPLHLSADYSPDAFVPRATLGAAQLAALGLIAATSATAWAMRRRAPGALFGLLWFVVTASVAANIIVPTGVLLAERVLYLPSVGAAIALGALWEVLPRPQPLSPIPNPQSPIPSSLRRQRWRGRLLWPATALALTLLAARSLARIGVWSDEDRFAAALVQDAPASYRSHWALGARAFEAGRYAEGEREYRRAMAIWPLDPAVPQELGGRYLSSGLFGPADRYLTLAWRSDSTRVDAALLAVASRLKAGRPDSAAALGTEAIGLFPRAPALLVATAEAFAALGKRRDALALLRRAAFAAPLAWQYQQLAAGGAALLGLCDEARRRAARASELAPQEATPRRLLGRIREGMPGCGVSP